MPGKRQNRRHYRTGNSSPQTGGNILRSILNIYKLNKMFHSQLINKTMILLLTNIAFMGSLIPFKQKHLFKQTVEYILRN